MSLYRNWCLFHSKEPRQKRCPERSRMGI